MKTETLNNYLIFLSNECSRHLSDKEISLDEINLLSLELKKFKNLINESELSNNIKIQINNLNFNQNNIKKRKNKFLSFLSTYNSFDEASGQISYYREQTLKIKDIQKFKSDVENIRIKIILEN